jgi:hypothetical protein
MSFDESIFSVGFNQKTAKEDLFVKGNCRILPHNRRGKTLEDCKRISIEVGHMSLTCGAGRPLGVPPVSPVATSVLHRLLG